VVIVGCQTSDCHYVFGASAAEKRVKQIKDWLKALGIVPERLEIKHTTVTNGDNLNEILRNFQTTLEKIESN